jgi:hypothetical protein
MAAFLHRVYNIQQPWPTDDVRLSELFLLLTPILEISETNTISLVVQFRNGG